MTNDDITYTQSIDALDYLGAVTKWLRDAPEEKKGYGTFYISSVEVVFDGDRMGTFENEDPDWLFVSRKSDNG